jgi:hypothetical protein
MAQCAIGSMTAMPRRLVAVLLYVLLLCMQHELARHPLEHLGAELANAHTQGWHVDIVAPCQECLLLAGGAHAVAAEASSLQAPQTTAWRLEAYPCVVARAATRHYSARAPPSLA